ncbi:MAG: GTP-binding protein [Bacteroidetes bacterium]|nr:GTP-binding protein [Bacteroidota bacterium]
MSTPIRNIAIIAHVDHGKTTLVDKMLHQARLFRDNQEIGELILDNNDLERERGITILAKNVSVQWKGAKINIIDTPGHADFGGEVERVLNMADGVLLLVDAFEGPMPQTRFVLQKALALGKKAIVVIDFKKPTEDLTFLMDTILEVVPAPIVREGTPQLQITSLDYSNYTGRIAIGRSHRGGLKENMPVSLVKRDGKIEKTRVKELFIFDGLGKRKVETVECGDICAITGIDNFEIGDTIADFESPEGMPTMKIDEPTMSMLFTINNSPFFGKEGKFVTSQKIKERLMKETEKNLALRVEETSSADQWLVFGRGILHLGVLVETMRREGYELQLGQPRVILKEIEGRTYEPIEVLTVDVPEEHSGKVIEYASQRKGEMTSMMPKGDMVRLEFDIPSRGLIGLRNNLLTATQGEAIMAHRLKDFEPWKGPMPMRINGVLISKEKGAATPYSMDKLKDRGTFFIHPGAEVYTGQLMGEHIKPGDLVVNLCTAKQMTNFRAAGKDDNTVLAPPRQFSLEEAMEYIQEDEYVEVTPENIRLRKVYLDENERKRASSKMGLEG